MDGEQDEALFEEADSDVWENKVDDPIPEESDDEDVYADDVTGEQFRELFRDSDEKSEFERFQFYVVVLIYVFVDKLNEYLNME